MLLQTTRRAARANRRICRLQGIQFLERRDMLSAGPPKVVAVEVASSAWDSDFVAYLQTASLGQNGYKIPVGSSAQAAVLPWKTLDRISLTFNEDVQIDAADLSLSGVNVVAYSFSDFHYDPQSRVATWSLSTPINKDRLRIDLSANGLEPVRDLDGNALDGEWVNNSSTFPSGNGTAGGDFEFTFKVLPTDVSNSGYVTYFDHSIVQALVGKSTTDAGYVATRDIDGNGSIDSADLQEVLNRMSQQLPSGNPAGTNNDAPTTSGFNRVQINNAAIDVAVALIYGFGDAENGGNGLTYSIVSNSNSALFDTASINPTTKELVLNAASGASGRANITVRGADAGGLFTETTITVDVNRQNLAPVITNVYFAYVDADTWSISGNVSDGDDDEEEFIVIFYGAFETRAAVDEYGDFEFAVVVEPEDWGMEYVVTYDPHGQQSNIFQGEIRLT